jgi:hypothetical protein
MAGQNSPKLGFSITDYNGETSSLAGYIFQPTPANLPDILTDTGVFRDAMSDIILGVVQREYGQIFNTLLDNSTPADRNAQRERKWVVSAQDTLEFLDQVNAVRNPNFRKITTMEIPTAAVTDPDGNSLLLEGTELADPANPYIAAFITAYETLYRSQAIGDLEVIEIRLVGRNL